MVRNSLVHSIHFTVSCFSYGVQHMCSWIRDGIKMKVGCGKTAILMEILTAGAGFAHFDKWHAG